MEFGFMIPNLWFITVKRCWRWMKMENKKHKMWNVNPKIF